MSAAEKLVALNRNRIYWPTDAAQRDVFANQILNALPQIVAVVEAAENVSEIERTGLLPDFLPLATALAALDEALQ